METTKNNWIRYIALLALLSGCGGSDGSAPEALVTEVPPEPAIVSVIDNVPAPLPPPPVEPEKIPDNDGSDTRDSDGDGVIDKKDAFPDDIKEWLDSDQDTVGDNSDNCTKIANPDQTNTDAMLKKSGESVTADGLGDACDSDPDGDGRAVVYVDGASGSDKSTGYLRSPVKTLTQGMVLAIARKEAVWVAIGEYDVSNVVWQKGSQLFGGYPKNFDPIARNVTGTKLLAPGKTTVVLLLNLSTDVRLDGFKIEASAVPAASSATVVIDNSVTTIVNCTITGNSAGLDDAAVRVVNNGFVTVDESFLAAKGSALGTESTGLWANNATVTLGKTIVSAGDAPHATGVRLSASTAGIGNQTEIKAQTNVKTQHWARGIWLIATAPKISDTTITVTGVQVEGIYFEKNLQPPPGTKIQNTILNVGGEPNPLLRDWQGVAYTSILNGDFLATFIPGVTQVFAELIGADNTGGNEISNGN